MDQDENNATEQDLPVVDTADLNQDLPKDYAEKKVEAEPDVEESDDGEV